MVDGWTVTAPEAPTTIPSRLRRKASSAPHGNRAIPAVGVHPPVRILPRGVPSKVTPALAALLDMSVADRPRRSGARQGGAVGAPALPGRSRVIDQSNDERG